MLGVEPPPLLRLPRQPRVRTPRQTFAPAKALALEVDAGFVNDGMWPQWRGPGALWPTEEVFWKFHPRNRGDPPNRD
jgi:hypothetical protein